ncbi:hypothetical protein AZI86_16635 [Bdellovibrio bacteriovorus]|uniref:Peptide ABC transporter substrate-binding protein n=1 Tax=Bdellovibrio bacteriovorus TaxID=959 RepID=A0A150WHC0_BDEBC|nr:hypothetical protein [Bdellovibrio bacteriovorus]KYG62459.1 hypothetical protein AZI86_16635 [Bdellovibrio bacteriovorus]
MKKLWISAFMIIATVSSQASAMIGNDQGNGGDAVLVGERSYSFDLYEAGLEKAPYFRRVALNPYVESAVNQALDPAIFPNKMLSAKLSELYADDPIITSFIEIQSFKF